MNQALLAAGERPFATAAEMDDHLLEAWRRRVEDEDLIICVGDVLHPEAQPATGSALRSCPGRRLLVLGNHDVGDRDLLRDVGFVDQRVAVLCATDPPLALTHVPLRRVPPTAINVHGHPARSAGAEPTAPQRQRRADRLRAHPPRPVLTTTPGLRWRKQPR